MADNITFDKLVSSLKFEIDQVQKAIKEYETDRTIANAESLSEKLWLAGQTVKLMSLNYGELWDKAREEHPK